MEPVVTQGEVEAALAPTALAGETLTEVALPEEGRSSWVVDVPDGSDLVAMWRHARVQLRDLGLLPVAVTIWSGASWPDWAGEDLFSRSFYGRDSMPGSVIERASALTVAEALQRFERPGYDLEWPEDVDIELRYTRHFYERAPEPTELQSVPVGDHLALERHLLDWEEQLKPTSPDETREAFSWFDPSPESIGLALLPVQQPGEAAAYLSFYGAEGPGLHEALVRLMTEWHTTYGAELVASWGTMMQFVVERPPETLNAAFDLAVQQDLVAPDTLSGPGESLRGLARHLWQGSRWFLHARP